MRIVLPLLACGLAWGLAGPAPAAELGRLLTDPGERARIEARRQESSATAAGQGTTDARRVRVDGVFRTSDGRRLVWLNGVPHDGRARRSPALVRRDGRVRLALEGRTVVLKPGQTYDQATGRIFDATEHPEPTPEPPAEVEPGGKTP